MKRLSLIFLTTSCFGMHLPEARFVTINIENNMVTQDEYFCQIAMQIYHKKTSFECSPEVKPYLLRTLDYSRHNGDSHKFVSMTKELTKDDEDFLMTQVNKAVSAALRDQKKQIDSSVPKKDAALWVAIGGFACTVITTAVTLGATLSGDCPK
jgi:hypothetical protein